jgi:SAM-dependent methyltransferase
MKETRDLWNAWSDDFQAAWNADTGENELPPAPLNLGPGYSEDDTLGLLPNLEETDVVVLGCGGGQDSVGFARRNTRSVTGVDLSMEQLHHLNQLQDAYNVESGFLAGDVTELPFADSVFDLAFSSWVFQMVDDLGTCFAEAARVLRQDGVFVFAMPHPFYEIFDPEEKEIERSYFDSEPERKSIGDIEADLVVFHRQIGEIHTALVDAGFTVERLVEPGTDDPDEYEEQWSQKPKLMMNVPPTLIIRAVL